MEKFSGTDYLASVEARKNRANREAAAHRVKLVNELANEKGVSVDQVTMVRTCDWQWNLRRNRTETEKTAIKVGENCKGRSVICLFAYVE